MSDRERPDDAAANESIETVEEEPRGDDSSGEPITTEALVDGDTIGSELRNE